MARKRTVKSDSDPIPHSDAANPSIAAIDRLPIRRRALVKALVSPDSPTYGNQAASYRAVYTTAGHAASRISASQALASPNTAMAVREEIERQGLGTEVRIGSIRDVLLGRHRAKSRTSSRKLDDGTIETTVESSPRAQDVLKAVALLDRLDGSDQARAADAKVREDTLRALTRRIMASMDKVKPLDEPLPAGEPLQEAGEGGAAGVSL